MHDVVLPAVERPAPAIRVGPPVHCFGGDAYRAGKHQGLRGTQEHAVAGLAASVHGDPAVCFRAFEPPVRLGCGNREPEADEDTLYHVAPYGSRTQIEK